MRAIVLSGGGACGAYEAGVWKALRKNHIQYDIVTGTSIGAINGMLMVQNDYFKCVQTWKTLDFNQLYDDFPTSQNKKDIYLGYVQKVLEGGINTSKMERLLTRLYNPKKLYHSPISFGVVAYNVTTKKVKYVTRENTSKERLKDYIMASATCFPVFQTKKIDNETFIDGGYYDNMPINLAIDLGATEVIAIDLGSIGLLKRIKRKEVKIQYIKPSSKLESFLMFEKKATNRMFKLGYLDGMKAFGKLEGEVYSFKKGTLINNYRKYYHFFQNIVKKYVKKPLGELKEINTNQNLESIMSKLLEDMMTVFQLDVTKIYSSTLANALLKEEFNKVEDVSFSSFDINEIKKILDRKIVIKYIYQKLIQNEKLDASLFQIFAKELEMALYFLTIRR